ncbi:hypothetical protein AAT19DRAFT_15526 [Rhodotorula toruloides]|uniref:J domain-containing protein n=1 Tax=Rhodotorula toruloides TaxID=5286 RepID=A0A2T0A7I9_RHOTO|nr:hypothetical protein AAT19DRAFT_15526 [Rhodotorula toruloides]
MPATPLQLRSRGSQTGLNTPQRADSPFRPSVATESRRALGLARDPGTPVGRLLASEGVAVRSPRRVRQRSWQERARDWPSNALLSLETSIQLLSFDAAGYPLGIALNILHFLVRLPGFYSALPSFSSIFRSSASTASRYARRVDFDLADADARLEALQRQTRSGRAGGWSWWAWWLSVGLILLSVGNAVYLASRRRKYQMVLRKDPIASPNARSAQLDFSPTKRRRSLANSVKQSVKNLVWRTQPEEPHVYPVQELDVWTPERVKWSLRIFTVYSPPIALMYHFLSPSNFLAFLLCGTLFTLQTFLLVHLYSTLVTDRAALQAEVMHEYNAKFVNPRVFVAKRDACVSTSQAEMVRPEDWLAAGPSSSRRRVTAQETESGDEVIRAGSGRKVRRRQSEMPARTSSLQLQEDEEAVDSPAPSRRPISFVISQSQNNFTASHLVRGCRPSSRLAPAGPLVLLLVTMSDDPADTFFPDADEIPSLYDVLGVSSEATDDEIKKAYRRLSLLNHPDKVAASASSPEDLAAATLKFQQIGFAYTVLKDAARREKYDLTGSTMEMSAEGAKTEAEWRDYFRELWTGEVSAQTMDDFAKKYQGSDEERRDILEAYKNSSGDIESILNSVMCATIADEDRFVKLINDAIAAKEIKATPAWTKSSKDTQGKEKRKKKADKEAKEAEELAKELGVHDKLYGNGSSASKGGKGKGKGKKADAEDDEASLRALIQGNQAKRMNSLIDSLEAKYAAAEAKKGKKRSSTGGEDGAKGGKKAKKEAEPTEEEFAAIQAKMDARRGKK